MARLNVIALDGPVAAGKTAVGTLVAQRLGYRFIDTGSMYRAFAWLALEEKVQLEPGPLARLAQQVRIGIADKNQEIRILVNGKDVTDKLRSPQVDQAASIVSTVPEVRRVLVAQQRAIAEEGRVVMAGRDIGTVVATDAQHKFFLTASVEERARRRHKELCALGQRVSYEEVLRGLVERDKRDSERAHSPLRPAEDAVVIDTDGLSLEQVVGRILELTERD